MTGVVYGEETAPRYEYDYNAKGQVARVRDNLLNRTTQSEYDLANRPVRVKTAEAGQHVYTGQVAYDNVYGNLSEFTEKVGENRQEYGTKFGYNDENRPTSLTYSASGKEIGQSTTTIDKLNRTTFSAVKLGSKTFTSEYHFAAGGYGTGSVTNLVSSITQPGCNCGYGYDDNGNIASATLNGKWTGYTYDELGQLIQVNDHSDTRSGENGTTWKYTYDLGGNILKKERFAYADTTNALETVTYEYGDANWRDKLTAVNGNAIAYDAIGNPLNDGTWTYTWQNGRQLQKMQKSGVTAEFVYNADGLRVQKTVNGVATKYTLRGKNVVHMTHGADELHFFYDAQNRPAVVVYNNVPYAYVKNLQGDIVALLNGAGNVVVSYAYDAWGAPIGKSGSMAETLGTLNPFRYRGYVFDEETGLYYLRSRYYSNQFCRFLNADSICNRNLFMYCNNAPIYYIDADGTSAKGFKPTKEDGYISPNKNGEPQWSDAGKGWIDKYGNVWEPQVGLQAHGGPHWDVHGPGKNAGYTNVYRGGKRRGGHKPYPKLPNQVDILAKSLTPGIETYPLPEPMTTSAPLVTEQPIPTIAPDAESPVLRATLPPMTTMEPQTTVTEMSANEDDLQLLGGILIGGVVIIGVIALAWATGGVGLLALL